MPLLRLLHQISNMYQNVKEAQNELREQPCGVNGKRMFPLKDESSLASETIDPTIESVNIPFNNLDDTFLEERYDKFSETYYNGNLTASTRRYFIFVVRNLLYNKY